MLKMEKKGFSQEETKTYVVDGVERQLTLGEVILLQQCGTRLFDPEGNEVKKKSLTKPDGLVNPLKNKIIIDKNLTAMGVPRKEAEESIKKHDEHFKGEEPYWD